MVRGKEVPVVVAPHHFYPIPEIEEFQEQLEDLLSGIQNTLESEIPRLKGSERAEVKNNNTRSPSWRSSTMGPPS